MKIIWCMVPEIWSVTNRIFFFILDHILSFYLPNNPENQNFEKMKKKKKKHLEISSFYIRMPKIMIICYTFPAIWHITDVTVFHFGLFLPFYPSNSPKNQHFQKNEKNYWRYHHFTHVHLKLWSYDVRFLKYGSWDGMDGPTDGRRNRQKKVTCRGGCPT